MNGLEPYVSLIATYHYIMTKSVHNDHLCIETNRSIPNYDILREVVLYANCDVF